MKPGASGAVVGHQHRLIEERVCGRGRDDDDHGRIVDLAGGPALALRVANGLAAGEQLMPYAPQTLAAVLTDANKDLGLHVKGRRAERTRPKHIAFLRRLGITLRTLP
jgi:hypothetical protein